MINQFKNGVYAVRVIQVWQTGGMGDVLTGNHCRNFWPQGLSIRDAVEAAVDLHAKSADLMSSEVGEVGLTPSDVIEGLRILLRYD